MKSSAPPAFLKRLIFLAAMLVIAVIPHGAGGYQNFDSSEDNRARLISLLIREELATHHFTGRKIDDAFSRDAFGLYLKQLDPQKRFLLKEDITRLSEFSLAVDDELNAGTVRLAALGEEILLRRIEMVREILRDLLARDFDFSPDEYVETDPKKLDYCASAEELKERWRGVVKLQVLTRYLTMLDDAKEAVNDRDSSVQPAKKPAPLQSEAREKLLKGYEKVFAKTLHEKATEGFNRYFDAVAKAFDPHTDYMPPANKEDFDISMKGSLEGIGATLKEEEGFIKVVSIIPGSPAYRQGELQVDDVILKVAEKGKEPVDITDMDLSDAVKLIRGKKGSEVTLTVSKSSGGQKTIALIRDVIQLEDASVKSTIIRDEKSGRSFGYIKVPSFYRDFEGVRRNGSSRNVTDDISAEIRKFSSSDISGLVLDLRNNGGGALTDAVNSAGLFIKTGPVLQIKSGGGKISVLSDDDPAVAYSGPLVVLVNRISASASEIVAAALQDYGRAVVIGGERTYGKGTVQTMIDLNTRIPFTVGSKLRSIGALRLTTQKFYRVTGGSTQNKGVSSDIVVPDRFRAFKGEEDKLDFALPWDTIAPVPFTKWDHPVADVAAIRERSAARTASNKEFAEIDRVTGRILDRQNRTLQSLKLDVVRKEREEMKADETLDAGPHGRSKEKKNNAEARTREERLEMWSKEVREDVYVLEGISVLQDMISAPARAAASSD